MACSPSVMDTQMDTCATSGEAWLQDRFVRSAAERCRMLANEFGDRPWRPACELGDGARDRHRLAARTLIGGDRESALDDGRRKTFSHAARPRFRLVTRR